MQGVLAVLFKENNPDRALALSGLFSKKNEIRFVDYPFLGSSNLKN